MPDLSRPVELDASLDDLKKLPRRLPDAFYGADHTASAGHEASKSPLAQDQGAASDWDCLDDSGDEKLLAKDSLAAQLIFAEDVTMEDRIRRVTADEQDLKSFWSIKSSPNRCNALSEFYSRELARLLTAPFDMYDQEGRVDYLLLRNYLERGLRRETLEHRRNRDADALLSFAAPLIQLIEARQACEFEALDPKHVAEVIHNAAADVLKTKNHIASGKLHVGKEAAYRALKSIQDFLGAVSEFYRFFQTYNPLFDWWVKAPYASLEQALQSLGPIIMTKLLGMRSEEDDQIVGEPIGRDGLLVELEAEMIPYTPEELLQIAMEKYDWCEKEMRIAASKLGFDKDWKAALRHVQNIYVDPGEQPRLVKSLVDSATAYVKKNDMVTVPPLAEKTWRMFMMSPARQKVNPFFLGGPSIIVSYPTAEMAHEDKLMSMRGNGPHLSKATAFHEMIPGHHLQLFVGERCHPYRWLFQTPFNIEGWAMYWELVFWDRGDFFTSPEDKIGTLFWRMHRCARILFSLKFHMGLSTPQQCVDLLVDMVGHERATAEGEVRRSLNGEYEPLYQAGYFLGAMQLYALVKEAQSKGFCEKEFHDRVLRANQMPIELLRALILEKNLSRDYKSRWKFYGDL